MAQQELLMVVVSPFNFFFHDHVQVQRWRPLFSQKTRYQHSTSWGSLVLFGSEVSTSFMDSASKHIDFSVPQFLIQAKSNQSFTAC